MTASKKTEAAKTPRGFTITTSALGHKTSVKKVPPTIDPSAPSLKPGLWLSTACTDNPTEESLAIRDAWQFKFPITQATELVENDPQVIFAATRWNEGRDTGVSNA